MSELVELELTRVESGLYEYAVLKDKSLLFEGGGFSSLEEALRAAAQDCPENFFCQVSYAGIVAGTYWARGLESSSGSVATLCAMNAATFAAGSH